MYKKGLLLLCSWVSFHVLAVGLIDMNTARQIIEDEYQTENLPPSELRAYSVCLAGSSLAIERVNFAQCVKDNLENSKEARSYLGDHLMPLKKADKKK